VLPTATRPLSAWGPAAGEEPGFRAIQSVDAAWLMPIVAVEPGPEPAATVHRDQPVPPVGLSGVDGRRRAVSERPSAAAARPQIHMEDRLIVTGIPWATAAGVATE
jgi:hypothetical protein